METNISSPKPWLREVEVNIEPEKLTQRVDEMIDTYRDKAEVPGFRKGKVPKEILRKRIGEAVESQVAEELVESSAAEVMKDQDFKLAARPELADLEIKPDKSIRFRIRVEVFPEFELKQYKGLKLEKHEPSGFDEEFEKRLRELQDRCAQFKPVRVEAKDGHFVTVDYETLDGDKTVAEPKKNLMIEVGDPMNFDSVNKGLVGTKAGDERSVEVRIPDDHPDKELAGKLVTFKFKVHAVKEKRVPEVDEELATDLGYDDLDALRQDINDRIIADRARLVQNDLKNQVFDRLLKEHDFEPPASWVKANFERLTREYELPDDEKTKEKLEQVAERRARFDVLAASIARAEDIEVTEEELKQQVEAFAKASKKPAEDIAPLLDNPAFRSQMLRDKVMDFIVEQAEVKESSIEVPKTDQEA